VVHTYVPLSSSSVTFYSSRDDEVLWLARLPQAWRKVMAAHRRGMTYEVTSRLTACTQGSALGPTLGITLPFLHLTIWQANKYQHVFALEYCQFLEKLDSKNTELTQM